MSKSLDLYPHGNPIFSFHSNSELVELTVAIQIAFQKQHDFKPAKSLVLNEISKSFGFSGQNAVAEHFKQGGTISIDQELLFKLLTTSTEFLKKLSTPFKGVDILEQQGASTERRQAIAEDIISKKLSDQLYASKVPFLLKTHKKYSNRQYVDTNDSSERRAGNGKSNEGKSLEQVFYSDFYSSAKFDGWTIRRHSNCFFYTGFLITKDLGKSQRFLIHVDMFDDSIKTEQVHHQVSSPSIHLYLCNQSKDELELINLSESESGILNYCNIRNGYYHNELKKKLIQNEIKEITTTEIANIIAVIGKAIHTSLYFTSKNSYRSAKETKDWMLDVLSGDGVVINRKPPMLKEHDLEKIIDFLSWCPDCSLLIRRSDSNKQPQKTTPEKIIKDIKSGKLSENDFDKTHSICDQREYEDFVKFYNQYQSMFPKAEVFYRFEVVNEVSPQENDDWMDELGNEDIFYAPDFESAQKFLDDLCRKKGADEDSEWGDRGPFAKNLHDDCEY